MWIVVSSESVTGFRCRECSVHHNLLVQMLMNVWNSLLVISMLFAPTHLGHSHVPAMKVTLEMEHRALVGVTVLN